MMARLRLRPVARQQQPQLLLLLLPAVVMLLLRGVAGVSVPRHAAPVGLAPGQLSTTLGGGPQTVRGGTAAWPAKRVGSTACAKRLGTVDCGGVAQFERWLEVEAWRQPHLRDLQPILRSFAVACRQVGRPPTCHASAGAARRTEGGLGEGHCGNLWPWGIIRGIAWVGLVVELGRVTRDRTAAHAGRGAGPARARGRLDRGPQRGRGHGDQRAGP